mgnify:CR=1 FL=1
MPPGSSTDPKKHRNSQQNMKQKAHTGPFPGLWLRFAHCTTSKEVLSAKPALKVYRMYPYHFPCSYLSFEKIDFDLVKAPVILSS